MNKIGELEIIGRLDLPAANNQKLGVATYALATGSADQVFSALMRQPWADAFVSIHPPADNYLGAIFVRPPRLAEFRPGDRLPVFA